MSEPDELSFKKLFEEACIKCFGQAPATPLTETESRHFATRIFDQTGLVIGAKSLKNYSLFVLDLRSDRRENPSVATLDTLVRFVENAPVTDEATRKRDQSHFPYWFDYRDKYYGNRRDDQNGNHFDDRKESPVRPLQRLRAIITGISVALVLGAFLWIGKSKGREVPSTFVDHFSSVNEDSLLSRGWQVGKKAGAFWKKRYERSGHLTLYTLGGDNWPAPNEKPAIKNLLLRPIGSDCFVTELHLSQFIPSKNWQQAGLLLLEDSSFSKKSLRLSIAYNDYFGGFSKPGEIIVQAISSAGPSDPMPEEIVHFPVFTVDLDKNLIAANLSHSALRIEKKGNLIRLLFGSGEMENPAFRELWSKEIDIQPAYVGIFAIKGFVADTAVVPVYIDSFRQTTDLCE